jgi:hypothetical protein
MTVHSFMNLCSSLGIQAAIVTRSTVSPGPTDPIRYCHHSILLLAIDVHMYSRPLVLRLPEAHLLLSLTQVYLISVSRMLSNPSPRPFPMLSIERGHSENPHLLPGEQTKPTHTIPNHRWPRA